MKFKTFAKNKIKKNIALQDMKMMVFFPIWALMILIGWTAVWIIASLYIFSAGSKKDISTGSLSAKTIGVLSQYNGETIGSTHQILDYNTTIQSTFAPHFFLFLWVNQMLIYFTYTVIAGAVSDWYFTERDERGTKNMKRPVSSACRRTCRYHMGTILVCAFIIAVVQFIRAMVAYMERMAGKKKNALQKLLFKLIHVS